MSPIRSREPVADLMSAAALAVSKAGSRDAGTGLPRMLARGPEVAACIEAFWLNGAPLDAMEIASRFGIGTNLAYALTVAVEDLDPLGPEVETVRIGAWLRERGSGLAMDRGDSPPVPLDDDLAWFAARPGRSHRILHHSTWKSVVRLVPIQGRSALPVALPYDDGPDACDSDEETASRAFRDAALAWLGDNQPPKVPDRDIAWFATRPDRRHMMRPALAQEVGGRSPSGWVVLVARLDDGRILRLCLDESTLPPSDRSDGDLGRIVRSLASDMASFAMLGFDARFENRGVLANLVKSTRGRPGRRAKLRSRMTATVVERLPTDGGVTPTAIPSETPGIAVARPSQAKATATPPPPTVPADFPVRPMAVRAEERSLIQFDRWSVHKASREKAAHSPALTRGQALELMDSIVAEHGTGPFRVHETRAACAARAGGDGFSELAALKHYGILQPGGDGRLRVIRTAHAQDDEAKATAMVHEPA